MESQTPVPHPISLDRFDEAIFSELDMSKSNNDNSDTHSNSTSDNVNTGRRRTKAERMSRRVDRKDQPTSKKTEKRNKENGKHDQVPTSLTQNGVTRKDFSKTLKVSKVMSVEDKLLTTNGSKNGTMKKEKSAVVEQKQLNKKAHNKNIRYDKSKAARAEKHRKNHIEYLTRKLSNKYKICEFTRFVAVKKIQRIYRAIIEERKERERIRFEQAKRRCRKNLARATIRKYATIFLVNRREKREMLEFHDKYNLEKIKHIQIKYRALKARPKKINVPRFKELFHAALLGWKIRRIISYLRTVPQVKEAIDYINLRNDIKDPEPSDLFSKQIIERYPDMIKIFMTAFEDLIDNAVWIKKPTIKTPIKQNRPSTTKKPLKERSKPNKIPSKPSVKKVETTKRKSYNSSKLGSMPTETPKHRSSMKAPQLESKESKDSNGPTKVEKSIKKTPNIQPPAQLKNKAISSTTPTVPKLKIPVQPPAPLPVEKPAEPKKPITPRSKPVRNAVGRKSLTALPKNGFGFGQFSNQRNILTGTKESIDGSDNEEDVFQPPQMEERPDRLSPIQQKRSPLDDLREDYNTRNREMTKSVNRPIEERSNIMNRSMGSLTELKLTSLKERRSQTRGMKVKGIQKTVESNALAKYALDQDDVVIERPAKQTSNNLEGRYIDNTKFDTLNAFTKIMLELMNKVETNKDLQLECLEECKRIIEEQKSIENPISNKSKVNTEKLKSAFEKPINKRTKRKLCKQLEKNLREI